MDFVDPLRGQFQGFMPEAAAEALIPVAETEDVFHPVMMIEAQHQGPDHVIQSRAKPPAGNDAGLEPGGVEKDPLPRPRHFHDRRLLPGGQYLLNLGPVVVVQDGLPLGDKTAPRHGRGKTAVAEAVDGKIKL